MAVHQLLLSLVALLMLLNEAFACSPPLIDGQRVRVAPLREVVAKADSIAQVQLEEETGPSWRVSVVTWLKGAGPQSMLVFGFQSMCPELRLRPKDGVIVFLAKPLDSGVFRLVSIGGNPRAWVASNYLSSDPSTVAEIKKVAH